MNRIIEMKHLMLIVGVFLLCFFLPIEWLKGSGRVEAALWEALYLVRWYAQEHVILCLIPAFFIAGAVAVFVSQTAVMKYLGPQAHKGTAYGVASVSGTLLAVCSCTILPLFAGIYRMGAGLGPACAFLYAGPAVNVLALVLTATVLGPQMGIARAIGAIFFAVIIGLLMQFFFRKDDLEPIDAAAFSETEVSRPLWQNALYFGSMVGILVFANWGSSGGNSGIWAAIYLWKWYLTSLFAVLLAVMLVLWFGVSIIKMLIAASSVLITILLWPENPLIPFVVGLIGLSLLTALDRQKNVELRNWAMESWEFSKKILPLLFFGVLIAGALLGRPDNEGLIPSAWVVELVGGNSLQANLVAAVVGAFMYFATLTEIPILQGLMGAGMGKGPALALLLAGPALSLPNMLVINSVMGFKKTATFVALVVVMATISGIIYGHFFP